MGDNYDFASLMAKLVIILSMTLIAASLTLIPGRAMAFAPEMLVLVLPLFVLTTLLDLRSVIRRR